MPMQPLRGQIMLTYRCSAACRHCLVMAAPQQDPTLVTVADAVEYGRDFQALGRQVLLAGGEALLYFEHVLAICRALREAGVPVGFVESNGSWCTTDERVRARLEQLKEAGVEGMYFSIDAFHQEFVPAERVHRGIRLARSVFGLRTSTRRPQPGRRCAPGGWRPTWMVAPRRAARCTISGGPPMTWRRWPRRAPGGVGTGELLRRPEIDTLAELQVDPFGYVRPDWCPGVNLGNTRHARLADLARTERVRQDPLLSDLAEGGPAALLPLARRFGITPEPAYASKCHLCFALRRQLVAHLPDAFGPEHVYQICARQ